MGLLRYYERICGNDSNDNGDANEIIVLTGGEREKNESRKCEGEMDEGKGEGGKRRRRWQKRERDEESDEQKTHTEKEYSPVLTASIIVLLPIHHQNSSYINTKERLT